MAEKFTGYVGGKIRDAVTGAILRSFSSNAAAVEGPPPPLLTAKTFSERHAQLRGLQKAADKAPGAPSGGALSSYIVVPDPETGGQMLKRVEPFNGSQAVPRSDSHVLMKPPVEQPNASISDKQARRPHHRGRTTNT